MAQCLARSRRLSGRWEWRRGPDLWWALTMIGGELTSPSPSSPGLRFPQPDLRAPAGCGCALLCPGWRPLGGKSLWGWAGASFLVIIKSEACPSQGAFLRVLSRLVHQGKALTVPVMELPTFMLCCCYELRAFPAPRPPCFCLFVHSFSI